MISQLTTNYSTNFVCLSLGLNRSSVLYQQSKGKQNQQSKESTDTLIRNQIERLINKPVSS